ncbi:hypothetical protein CAL13_17055 [Bordetella genomosp. 9]|uniref:ShET2 enterotoxin N-terminal domain-containing protein n=1 Tax=Bordetella genomosp. 9 TaxID=1416803 RepID=A0A1W6Z2W9_9BORD|nr:hypothetical protein CAL13_17055 [Bordetella genomosp. 9]
MVQYANLAATLRTPQPPNFTATFFERHEPEPLEPDHAPPGEPGASQPGIRYTAASYGSHAEFESSPDFARYRDEVRNRFDALVAFCRREGMSDTDAIKERFDTFFANRFGQRHFFSTQAQYVDGPGKQSLDSFCRMVADERYPLDARKAAVRNLSEGVTKCAAGAVANLVDADRDLSLSIGGFRAAIWRAKESVARAAVLNEVEREYGRGLDSEAMQIHRVEQVMNHLALGLGLPRNPDPLAQAAPEPELLDASALAALKALAPDLIATKLAEDCLGAFQSLAAEGGLSLSGALTSEANGHFEQIAKRVSADIGLGQTPLKIAAFLKFPDDGDAGKKYDAYEIRSEPSVLAWHILAAMDAEGLLETRPVSRGGWTADGCHYVLCTYGDSLAWSLPQTIEDAIEPGWNGDPEPVRLTELFAWSKVQSGIGRPFIPPAAALAPAIKGASADDLTRIPPRWLADKESMLALADRMDATQLQRYLQSDVAFFQHQCPPKVRAALADRIMARADAPLELIKHLCPDPWAFLNEKPEGALHTRIRQWFMDDNVAALDAVVRLIEERGETGALDPEQQDVVYQVLHGASVFDESGYDENGHPILYMAIGKDQIACIDAWGRLLKAAVSLGRVKSNLDALLTARVGGGTALRVAMSENRGDAIRAFHRILADASIAPHIGAHMASLVGLKETGQPLLHLAMEEGCADAVKAYGELLTDPMVFDHIEPMLPLVLRSEYSGLPALAQAMAAGHADAVDAYSGILSHPSVIPSIAGELVTLVASRSVTSGASALLLAMQNGRAAAVRSYRALLTHPAVLPHLRAALPGLVAGRTNKGSSALAMAMAGGRTQAIEAYRELLTDASISQHIVDALPDILLAKRSTGEPGLFLAALHGHAKAIEAYHALLADSVILPHVKDRLPDLLSAKNNQGKTVLAAAMEDLRFAALSAYYAMLADANIARHLSGDQKRQLVPLPAPPEAEPARHPALTDVLEARRPDRPAADLAVPDHPAPPPPAPRRGTSLRRTRAVQAAPGAPAAAATAQPVARSESPPRGRFNPLNLLRRMRN